MVNVVLISHDSWTIIGKGLIFNVNRHDSPEVEDVVMGDIVNINNRLWDVIGIERAIKPMDPPLPGDNYGLVVKEHKQTGV